MSPSPSNQFKTHTDKTKQNGISAGSGMTCHVMIRTTPESRRVNQNLQPRRERVLLVGFYFGITVNMTCMAEGKSKQRLPGGRGKRGFGVSRGCNWRPIAQEALDFFVKRFLSGRMRCSAVHVADGFVAISYLSSGLRSDTTLYSAWLPPRSAIMSASRITERLKLGTSNGRWQWTTDLVLNLTKVILNNHCPTPHHHQVVKFRNIEKGSTTCIAINININVR